MMKLSDDLVEVFRDVAVDCRYKLSEEKLRLLNQCIDKARHMESDNAQLLQENDRLRTQTKGGDE